MSVMIGSVENMVSAELSERRSKASEVRNAALVELEHAQHTSCLLSIGKLRDLK